jgi:hypothetical protein
MASCYQVSFGIEDAILFTTKMDINHAHRNKVMVGTIRNANFLNLVVAKFVKFLNNVGLACIVGLSKKAPPPPQQCKPNPKNQKLKPFSSSFQNYATSPVFMFDPQFCRLYKQHKTKDEMKMMKTIFISSLVF